MDSRRRQSIILIATSAGGASTIVCVRSSMYMEGSDMRVVSSTFHIAAGAVVALEVRLVVRGCWNLLSIANGPARNGMLGTAGTTIMDRMMGASGRMFDCSLLSLMVFVWRKVNQIGFCVVLQQRWIERPHEKTNRRNVCDRGGGKGWKSGFNEHFRRMYTKCCAEIDS